MNESVYNKIDDQFIEYIKLLQHVNFGIDTLSTVIVIGIIMFKSPKEMNAYKYFLLNITVRIYPTSAVAVPGISFGEGN